MRLRRSSFTASAIAFMAHAALALGILGRALPKEPPPAVASTITEIPLDLEPPPPEAVSAPTEARSAPGSAPRGASAKAAAIAAASTDAVAEPMTSAVPVPVGEPAASSFSFDPRRRAPVELRLGAGSWPMSSGSHVAADGPALERTADPKAAERSVREALSERDVALGLGHAGPLVTAAHDAMTANDAPDVGIVLLEVDCDATGHVVAARADTEAGAPVARALIRAMAGKALRVPTGVRGLRARLRLSAARTLPAGEQRTRAAGAVPDDIPGGKEKVCDGEGVTRRCVAGMPVGATATAGDLSNIGARPSRVVHVSLLGEAVL